MKKKIMNRIAINFLICFVCEPVKFVRSVTSKIVEPELQETLPSGTSFLGVYFH